MNHTHEIDPYGSLKKGCPICDKFAQDVVKSGCTRDPYRETCGHAFDTGACGKCDRVSSTN